MIYHSLLIISAIYLIAAAENVNIEFSIRKKHPNWQQFQPLGKLTLTLIPNHQTMETHITPLQTQLIQQSDFEDNSPLIIEFAAINTNHPDYKSKVYLTSVDEYTEIEHGQKITLVTGFAQGRFHINSINYIQTRDKVGEIFTEIVYTDEEYHEIFKYNQIQKKSAQEQQSFFSKYKWPLIIGGVVLYTMMTVDPKAAEGAAPK